MSAENTTRSPWSLPYPSPVGKVKLGAADFQELAERLTTIFAMRFVTFTEQTTSFTASSGELIRCGGNITVTLPSVPEANAMIGVVAYNHSVEVTAGSNKIYGDFVEGATKVKLVGYQHLLLQSDGTNWFIVAGEPKREQGYTTHTYSKAEAEAGVEPSATRPSIVNVGIAGSTTKSYLEAALAVGGVEVANWHLPEGTSYGPSVTMPLFLEPGEKWALKSGSVGVFAIPTATRIL